MICHACQRPADDVLCPTCAALCRRARDGFQETPRLAAGRVTGVASTSIEEHCQDWPTYTTERKELCRPRFVAALEQVLDIQAKVVREYGDEVGLPVESVAREIVSAASRRTLAQDLLAESRPGDHLILFGHAGGATLSSHPITATSTFASRCAEKGVGVHLAALGLDLTNPLAQYALRLGQDALLFWNTRQVLDRFGGGVKAEESEENLFGLVDRLARWDARVRWVVRGVRSGLSPAELAERGEYYYLAAVLPKRGTKFALTVNADRPTAIESVCSARYLCLDCGTTAMSGNCPRCGKKPLGLGRGIIVRGVKFSEFPDVPVDRQLLACWDFHRRLHPGRDAARPWELSKSA